MSLSQEQIEYLKFRKSLDKALLENELINVDYEYNLSKKSIIEDSNLLLKYLSKMDASLRRIRELMR